MYQKSENMWSFQMTPFNYRYVIFMCAKCLHCIKTEQSSNIILEISKQRGKMIVCLTKPSWLYRHPTACVLCPSYEKQSKIKSWLLPQPTFSGCVLIQLNPRPVFCRWCKTQSFVERNITLTAFDSSPLFIQKSESQLRKVIFIKKDCHSLM